MSALTVGQRITLREANSTHPAREWTVTAVEGGEVKARGLAWPGARAAVEWTFKLDSRPGKLRRVHGRGSELYHVGAPHLELS